MPEYFEPQIEDISEAALQERIKLRKVKASVDMFDQLLQAGDLSSFEASLGTWAWKWATVTYVIQISYEYKLQVLCYFLCSVAMFVFFTV